MGNELNWDEFRLVKAIADSHSLVGAAETLGLNHSTVFRRLAALEASIGQRLFERSRSGYQPTAAGEEMIGVAANMGDAVNEFERRVAGRDVKPTGDLCVTTFDALAFRILPPILARFREINPGVQIEVVQTMEELNLSRRDADVALRATNGPAETLVGRKICVVRWGVFATREFAARYKGESAAEAPWIGFADNFGSSRVRRWLEKKVDPQQMVFRLNSLPSMLEMAILGVGMTALPCFLGDGRSDLVRSGAPPPELDVELWMLTHPDLRHAARVRAFTEYAGAELVRHRRLIEGEMGEVV